MIVIIGPSGIGKTTWARRLVKENPTRLALATTATTRTPRPDEHPGRDYFFLSDDAFEDASGLDLFIERDFFDGHHYGIPRASLDIVTSLGLTPVVVLTSNGASDQRVRCRTDLCVALLPRYESILSNRRSGRAHKHGLTDVPDRGTEPLVNFQIAAHKIIWLDPHESDQFQELQLEVDAALKRKET
jgi:guanylate kinase